jgi:hypothetical protein
MNVYPPYLTAALTHEHIEELLRAGDRSRLTTAPPGATRHRTPRRRAGWWSRSTARLADL